MGKGQQFLEFRKTIDQSVKERLRAGDLLLGVREGIVEWIGTLDDPPVEALKQLDDNTAVKALSSLMRKSSLYKVHVDGDVVSERCLSEGDLERS